MTSHELANQLLEGPDVVVVTTEAYGDAEVEVLNLHYKHFKVFDRTEGGMVSQSVVFLTQSEF